MIYNLQPFSSGTINAENLCSALKAIGNGEIIGAASSYSSRTAPDGFDYGCSYNSGHLGFTCGKITDGYTHLLVSGSKVYTYDNPSKTSYYISLTADTVMTVMHDENGLVLIFDGMPFIAFIKGISITDSSEVWQFTHMVYVDGDESTTEKGMEFYVDSTNTTISHSLLAEDISKLTSANTGATDSHIYHPLIYKGYSYPMLGVIDGGASVISNGIYSIENRYFYALRNGLGVITDKK